MVFSAGLNPVSAGSWPNCGQLVTGGAAGAGEEAAAEAAGAAKVARTSAKPAISASRPVLVADGRRPPTAGVAPGRHLRWMCAMVTLRLRRAAPPAPAIADRRTVTPGVEMRLRRR